jgi:hypothetical protein
MIRRGPECNKVKELVLEWRVERDEQGNNGRRYLRDGIYNVADIEYMSVQTGLYDIYSEEDAIKILDFIVKHPDFVIASAYGTNYTILLATRPSLCEYTTERLGYGFNYGSTNIIHNCPKHVLILTRND